MDENEREMMRIMQEEAWAAEASGAMSSQAMP
jgi:hypothetical protein